MNYNSITTTALAYADRKDQPVIDMMSYFLLMVESRINRLLVIEDMSNRYRFPEPNPTDGRYELPADFSAMQDIAIVNMTIPSSRMTLSLLNPEQMNTATNTTNVDNSKKHFYQVLGNQLIVQPVVVDGTSWLEIVYYGNIIPLNIINTTNWISDNHPDLYINGLVTEINAFVKDAEATNLWNTRFLQTIQELKDADELLVYSGTPLQVRLG
jgi:hypothetical protein